MNVLDFLNNPREHRGDRLCLDGLNAYMNGSEDEVTSIVCLNPLMQALRGNQITKLGMK